ncbi:hypothetical protein FBU30_008201 [Linnemannia zychae]|nr:hypothetical protein FBU30_008201 [Linnemannia zychae]
MPTAQEKRELLFNVHAPIELPTKEFDEDWWPLISNAWSCSSGPKPTPIGAPLGYIRHYTCRLATKHIPKSKDTTPVNKRRQRPVRAACDCQAALKITHITATGITIIERFNDAPMHTHSLVDVDKVKRPAAIKALIGKEAMKSTNTQDTIASIRQLAEESGLGEVAAFVTRSELNNTRRRQRQTELEPLLGAVHVDDEVQAATTFLSINGYHMLLFKEGHVAALTDTMPIFSVNEDINGASNASSSIAQGLTFAKPQQLAKLTAHGWLTLIGMAEETNRHGWKLFTLYVRDQYGCWDSGAHFFLSETNSSNITEALQHVRQLAPSWKPQYVLTDSSLPVTAAIEAAFPKSIQMSQDNEEQHQCNILYSSTHVIQNWEFNIPDTPTRCRMIQALQCRTKLGYEYLIQKAISSCNNPTTLKYIQEICIANAERWAMWARQELPLLLQVPSLTVLDVYHCQVRHISPIIYGLTGACQAIKEIDDSRTELADKAIVAKCTDETLIVNDIASPFLVHIQKFPYTIQNLLSEEACAMASRVTKGKKPPGLKRLQCECDFFNKYSLPCQHIMHEAISRDMGSESMEPFLGDTDWMAYKRMFSDENKIMDIYRIRRPVWKGRCELTIEAAGAKEVQELKLADSIQQMKLEFHHLVDQEDNKALMAFVSGAETFVSSATKNSTEASRELE